MIASAALALSMNPLDNVHDTRRQIFLVFSLEILSKQIRRAFTNNLHPLLSILGFTATGVIKLGLT
jgi:hypothetical protein